MSTFEKVMWCLSGIVLIPLVLICVAGFIDGHR